MTTAQIVEPTSQRPLRLWPGVVAAVLGWLVLLVVPFVAPAAAFYGVIGGLVGGLGGVGGGRLVAVLQPGALARARGRHRPDGRRDVRDVAPRPRVGCGGGDGDVDVHL